MIEYYVRDQEEDGPKVDPFIVPGADLSFRDLAKLEKQFKKDIAAARKEEKKRAKKGDDIDLTTGLVTDAADKIFGGEAKPMKSRGWRYMKGSKIGWRKAINGSMTTSGIISLVVAKAWLEDLKQYAPYKAKCDQAMRDGCAWIAHNFTVSTNPVSQGHQPLHHYYYLYGLERAGMLTMCMKFGKHDWYVDGSKLILSRQSGDGSWQTGGSGTVGPVVDTCFALLFLKRATQPLVKMPKEIYTGGYLGGGKKDKE